MDKLDTKEFTKDLKEILNSGKNFELFLNLFYFKWNDREKDINEILSNNPNLFNIAEDIKGVMNSLDELWNEG